MKTTAFNRKPWLNSLKPLWPNWMKGRAAETSAFRVRAERRPLPALVLAVCFILLCRPGLPFAGERADDCLSCHIPGELFPIGIPYTEGADDHLKWRVCPGMAEINRAAFLTESSLTELDVLTYQGGYRESSADQTLWDAEARYRLLREKPITSQSELAEKAGELRRQLDAIVLKPMVRNTKQRRLLLILLAGGAVLAAVVMVILWRIFVRRSR